MDKITSYRFLVFFILLFSLYACTDNTPQIPPLPPESTILAFGDSLTFGTGADKNHNYPAVLQMISLVTVINAGVPGELSAQGLARLPALLEKHHPQLLILCHGGNDLLRKKDTRQLINNLKEMIRLALIQGIPVVLLGVPEPKPVFMQTAPFYKEIAAEFNIPIENNIITAVLKNNVLKSDTIHPNSQGYEQIAQAIYQLLIKTGTF